MFAVKSNASGAVTSWGHSEITDPQERLKKVLAEAKAIDITRLAEIKAAREEKAYFMSMHSEIDQMLKDMTKTHNDHNIMSSQIKLGLVNNVAKLIARIEYSDQKIAELENRIVELDARIDDEIAKYNAIKTELDKLSYSRSPFVRRMLLAARGERE